MKIIEHLRDRGATDSLIQRLEAELEIQLPDDYRGFLLETNGGRPEPIGFPFQTSRGQEDSLVDWFFTLEAGQEPYTIRDNVEAYAGRIPDKLLPIACDPFGNLVLLDLGAKTFGSIYFWDHERKNMEVEAYWDNISFVAPSFTKFIEMLQ